MGSTSAAGDFDSLYSFACFTAVESDVAGILLNLPKLLNKSESSSYQFPSLWGSKKKRSAINAPDSDSLTPAVKLPPVAGKLDGASPTPSPTAPMDFPSPIASDSKPLPPKNRLPSGLKEELLTKCERLTVSRDQLQREIKKVEARRDELMAENQILREKSKQQVERASLVALPFNQSQPLVGLAPQPHYQRHPRHPLIVFPYQQRNTGDLSKQEEGYPRPSSELEYRYRMTLVAMAQSKAAAAAMARRNRRLIQKTKSFRLPRSRK